ncbi:MAG: YIP1 family protein [Propionibacteriaceae bacterium]|jgi:hypothetical protein|nr:YIP1 family protein [Propionibacteriaceae bacterium]
MTDWSQNTSAQPGNVQTRPGAVPEWLEGSWNSDAEEPAGIYPSPTRPPLAYPSTGFPTDNDQVRFPEFTSVTSQEATPTQAPRWWSYLIAAVLCGVIALGYGFFGHGVRSSSMDLMFLYPLVGGALLVLTDRIARQGYEGPYRLGVNLVVSGLATLTVGAFLRGIVEIAGSSSPFIEWFTTAGWGLTVVGVVTIVWAIVRIRRA